MEDPEMRSRLDEIGFDDGSEQYLGAMTQFREEIFGAILQTELAARGVAAGTGRGDEYFVPAVIGFGDRVKHFLCGIGAEIGIIGATR